MHLYRITKSKYAEDLTGEGAKLYGGRWNEVGTPSIYTATSISLSLCEFFVNLPSYLLPSDLILVTFEIEEKHIVIIDEKDLPEKWNSYPIFTASQKYGSSWLEKEEVMAFSIPSVIVPQERNVVLNPRGRDFAEALKIVSTEEFKLDSRFEK